MSGGKDSKGLQEFLGEAQDIVDELGRVLMEVDRSLAPGQPPEPHLVNAAFRSVHTLKGLSGLFGVASMAELSHDLEEVLDNIRMGRVQLDREFMDLLFEALDLLQRMMAAAQTGGEDPTEQAESLVARIRRGAASRQAPDVREIKDVELDSEVLGVLTEYEEHRLRQNIAQGSDLFFVRCSFELSSIDSDLETLKAALQPFGELITYLPSSDAADENRLDLEVLVASKADGGQLERAAADSGHEVSVRKVAQRRPSQPAAPPVEREEEPAETLVRSVSQTVRVDIRRLDGLMNVVGELNVLWNEMDGVIKRWTADTGRNELSRHAARTLRLLGRRVEELQTGILEVRMVPLEQLFDKLSRVVRKLSREAGKTVEFFVSGGETELDKLIVEELSDPLMHIIRNCMDHGIETQQERIRAQKSPEGMIALRAFQKGNHVVIEVEDDGVGIDRDRVMETAVQRGIVDQQITSEMTDREILNLIFAPGFTTRIEADAVSGRGVGMDVVKTNLARLSGLIDIQSSPAMGTKFILTLPVTLAIIQALVVRVAEQLYAVPLASVLEALAIRRSDIRTVERREVISLRRSTLPLVRLRQMFDLPAPSSNGERQFVIVVGMAQHRIGLVVDELRGQQDVVIKSLGPSLSSVPGIAGATELGDQRIALVLDLAALVDEAVHGEGRTEPG